MKTRKLLAVVLAVAMLASFVSIPVFAEGEGEVLETLGILIGPDEDGVTEAYLATPATRVQAALIKLRLEGLDEEAEAFEGTETFTDAADATEYWQPILEYLKANPDLGWNGYPDGSFDPTGGITGQEFTKVILVNLGYVEGVDFTWETVMDFAASIGLEALAELADEPLTVGDVAAALVEALGTKTNAVTDITLISQLVIDGVIDEADAVAAGFEVEEEALVIVAAYASATDTVTVEMSTDVPEGTAITLKKGTAGFFTNDVVDGATVTLTALYNLPAGTYTVTVGDSSADLVVEAQHAVSLVIEADTLYLRDGEDLKVSLLDQYDTPMSLTGTNYSIFNQDDGYVYDPDVNGTFKVDLLSEGSAEAGDTIYVFVYDPASTLSVSGELPILAAPYLETLTVGGVTIGDEDDARLYEWTANHILDVKGFDQYGQEMTLTNSDFDTMIPSLYGARVQVLSSNGNVIPAGSYNVTSGEFTFDSEDPGMAMFTFVIPAEAFIVTSEMITVYADPELASIEIAGPAGPLYAFEAAEFAVLGFDQYGDPYDTDGGSGISFTVTNPIFDSLPDMIDTNEGSLTFGEEGSSTVYYFLDGIFQGTFDVAANAEALPFQITGVTAPGGLEEGVCVVIMSDDIEVIDQYGRVMADPFGTGYPGQYDWELMTSGAADLFDVYPDYPGFRVCAYEGEDTGEGTFIAKLLNFDGPYPVMTESAFSFGMWNVETEDVDGFAMTIDTDTTMYTGSDWSRHWEDADEKYFKYVEITGEYGGMSLVLYDGNDDGLPDLIDLVTSTNDAVMVMSGSVLIPTAAVDGSTTIKAWRNGAPVAMADLALSDTAPDWTTTEFDVVDGEEYLYEEWSTIFDLIDQYGVQISYYLSSEDFSPDTLTPYVIEVYSYLGGDSIYTIVKWDGSISATFIDVDDDDGVSP